MAVGIVQAAIVLVGAGWVPVLGPAMAGFLAARRQGPGRGGLVVGALCAAAAFGALWVVSLREVSIGGTQVGLGPLALVAPATAIAVLAGAGFGVQGRAVRGAGVGLLLVSAWLYWVQGSAVLGVVRAVMPRKSDAPAVASSGCTDRLKALNTALMIYSDSWDGMLPPADRWFTAIKDNLKDEAKAGCPQAPAGSLGYAMNDAVGGKELAGMAKAGKTVVLFEVDGAGKDQHGDVAHAPRVARHSGADNALFSDGSAGPR